MLTNLTKPTLKWKIPDTNEAITYHLQVNRYRDFSDQIAGYYIDVTGISKGSGTEKEYTLVSDLTTGYKYYWRVGVVYPSPAETIWGALSSFILDTNLTFEDDPNYYKPSTWCFIRRKTSAPYLIDDYYEFDIYPVYKIEPIFIMEEGKNLDGDILREIIADKDKIIHDFSRAYIPELQYTEIMRFLQSREEFFLGANLDDTMRIWKVIFEKEPDLKMLSGGNEWEFKGNYTLIETEGKTKTS